MTSLQRYCIMAGIIKVKPLVWLRASGCLINVTEHNRVNGCFQKHTGKPFLKRYPYFSLSKEAIEFRDLLHPRTVIAPDQTPLSFKPTRLRQPCDDLTSSLNVIGSDAIFSSETLIQPRSLQTKD